MLDKLENSICKISFLFRILLFLFLFMIGIDEIFSSIKTIKSLMFDFEEFNRYNVLFFIILFMSIFLWTTCHYPEKIKNILKRR